MVEACLSGVVQYKKLFQGAKSAGLRDRVVSWSPAKIIQGDGIRDAGVLQVPNIPGQLSVPAFLPVVEVRFVSSPLYFECIYIYDIYDIYDMYDI